MKKFTLLLLLITQIAFAETNYVGVQGSFVLPYKASETHQNKAGFLVGITASSETNQTFFRLPVKTNVFAGMLANSFPDRAYNVPYIGIDKELVLKSNATGFFPSVFAGIGYKFTAQQYKTNEVDIQLPSRLHARVGLKLNYRVNDWQFGIVGTHISNGDVTLVNVGYNMVGFEVLKRI